MRGIPNSRPRRETVGPDGKQVVMLRCSGCSSAEKSHVFHPEALFSWDDAEHTTRKSTCVARTNLNERNRRRWKEGAQPKGANESPGRTPIVYHLIEPLLSRAEAGAKGGKAGKSVHREDGQRLCRGCTALAGRKIFHPQADFPQTENITRAASCRKFWRSKARQEQELAIALGVVSAGPEPAVTFGRGLYEGKRAPAGTRIAPTQQCGGLYR